MKIKSIVILAFTLGIVSITGCQKGDLISNPNVATGTTVPVPLLLNHITANLIRSGEEAWGDSYKYAQYWASNYTYYRGSNFYNWSYTSDTYDILQYTAKMEEQASKSFGNKTNVYFAISKFFRAYAGIWYSQRVGDIPFSQAGDPAIAFPKFDSQHDVYKQCLTLLDDANTLMASNVTAANQNSVVDAAGDIFGLTYLQWQKLINSYKLRVLISLSKRANDNSDLLIPQQFAAIVSNPAKYPIMTSNSDNVVYKFNAAFNAYPIFAHGNAPYNNYANIGKTLLDITTANQDPRTFAIATPAPVQIANGKLVSDFTAYVGADNNLDQGNVLGSNASNGLYSYTNFNRYYTSSTGANAEAFIFFGYPELCFNIAEGINRGWATGVTATWYNNGIAASLKAFGLTDGQVLTIGDVGGTKIGTVTLNFSNFLTNTNVIYAGDNATGLTQILQQKYCALFNNSGWEAFYNWRRTGIPALTQGGVGIGTPNNLIPRRWLYVQSEAINNAANYKTALTSQFSSTTETTGPDNWATK